MRTRTEQEEFWAGEFGTLYAARNSLAKIVCPDIAMWTDILRRCQRAPASAFEMGCNIGANLFALKSLLPEISLTAVEINPQAAELAKNSGATIHTCSILDFAHEADSFDLVFSCGVLIHINPDFLPTIYEKLYLFSKKYILINEYYNPTPLQIPYRGHANKLFKRDFAGEMLDMFPDLKLVDYRFIYHRDPVFPRDDSTWFLLEKSGCATR